MKSSGTSLPFKPRKQRLGRELNVSGLIAIGILVFILLCTLLAPWLAPYDPLQVQMSDRLAPVSYSHILGTDTLGRDVFSRLLYGGRISIVLAAAVTATTMLIGIVIGTVAGYFGGRIDDWIQNFISMFQGLPSLSLMLAIAGTLGPGTKSLFIALIFTSWADFSRVVRGEAMKIREESYIEGIRAVGASHSYIISKYILPNMIGPLIVLFTIRLGRVMLSIASLSFLGLGLQPPAPDWGVMVSDARSYFRSHLHLIIAPGLCIVAVSLSMNLLGDALRDALDSKLTRDKTWM